MFTSQSSCFITLLSLTRYYERHLAEMHQEIDAEWEETSRMVARYLETGETVLLVCCAGRNRAPAMTVHVKIVHCPSGMPACRVVALVRMIRGDHLRKNGTPFEKGKVLTLFADKLALCVSVHGAVVHDSAVLPSASHTSSRRSIRHKRPPSDEAGTEQFCKLPTMEYDALDLASVSKMKDLAIKLRAWGQPCKLSPKAGQGAALQLAHQTALNSMQNSPQWTNPKVTIDNGGKVDFETMMKSDCALSIGLNRREPDVANPPADALRNCGSLQGQIFTALESAYTHLGFTVEARAVATGLRRPKEIATTHWDEGCNFGFCVGSGKKMLICAPNSALAHVVDPTDKDRNPNQNRSYRPLEQAHSPEEGASIFFCMWLFKVENYHHPLYAVPTQAAFPGGTWLICNQATSSCCQKKCGTTSIRGRLR